LSGLDFDDERSRLIEAMYTVPDIVRRRAEIARLLAPRPGERLLDIGCGPGFVCAELAAAVGREGAVAGVDASTSMLALARRRLADHSNVSLREADAVRLPFDDASFDGAVSTQVYEYVADIDAALAELARVLKPGGRALVLDTDWPSICWHSSDPERMTRVLAAWDEHLAHPALPRVLSSKLRASGFRIETVEPFVLLNAELEPATYSFGVLGGIAAFVPGRGGVTEAEAQAWASDLFELGGAGDYFFSLVQYSFVLTRS
jgi:arsenite methyltransferase